MTRGDECPSEDELVKMVEGALGDMSLVSIETHVDHCERCAAVIAGLGAFAPAGSDPDEPRRVGRYQLDRRIAAGGMGEVWAAWDPQLRREIAVKLVRPERADDHKERDRLLREARALARLGHPNVLAVHDVGEADGEVFIATELVSGDTLASRGGVGADWRALTRLYIQAARGLAAAHAAGLVHRDIKPSNLLLGADGRVRVADFGLAVRQRMPPSPSAPTERSAEQSVQITATGHIAGTPAYMAPEQRAGRPADARVDQYALCVALAEGIGGRRPPTTVDRDQLLAFFGERRAPEPELAVLCRILARGLAIDPRHRFPDMRALADALDALAVARAPVPAAAEHAATAPVRRRPRRSAAAIVVAVLAAAAGIAAVLILARFLGPHDRTGASGSAGPPAPATTEPGSGAPRASDDPAAPDRGSDPRTTPADRGSDPRGTPADRGSDPRATPAEHGSDPRATPADRGSDPRATPADRGSDPRATPADRGSDPRATPADRGSDARATTLDGSDPRVITPVHGGSSDRPTARDAAGSDARPRTQRPSSARIAPPKDGSVPGAQGSPTARGSPTAAPPATPPAPPASPTATPSTASPTAPSDRVETIALPQALSVDIQRAILGRDAKRCLQLMAQVPPNLHPAQRETVEHLHAHCEMIAGDCARGTARLAKHNPHPAGSSSAPRWVTNQADTYCPIEGDLDTRLRRMWAQIDAFTGWTPSDFQTVVWCDSIVPHARTAAGEVATAPQAQRMSKILRRLATCVSSAARCDEARALWQSAVDVDPSTPTTPALTTRCP